MELGERSTGLFPCRGPATRDENSWMLKMMMKRSISSQVTVRDWQKLVPRCKGRCISKVFSLLQPRSPLFSTAINSLQVTSHGVGNENRGIDFDVLFQSCTKLHLVKHLHALLVVSGKIQSIFIATKLVNRYANLGDVSFSRYTFDHISNKNVYTWNSMVSAYVHSGRFQEAIDCFYQFLLTSGLLPDFYTFPPVLKACRNLFDGKNIHCLVLKLGFEWDVFVAASLLHMYCRFGLAGYAQNGHASEAIEVYQTMEECTEIIPNQGTWTAAGRYPEKKK
ncbi:hypothetical protein QYF36_008769 [Acer negundo]|nr:hypothetical protein QYF36_008769 [Acer negundo]